MADIAVSVEGTTIGAAAPDESECARVVCDAALGFLGVVEAELGSNIALDKADVVGSSPRVVALVRRTLQQYAGRDQGGVASLDVDMLAGRPRRVLRRGGRAAERMKTAAYRVVRLQRLAKMRKCPRVMSL